MCVRLHRLVDAVKGGKLSYTALAMEREQTAYRSLLPLSGAVLADPEPMPSRLVRGCIALAFTASVRAVAPPSLDGINKAVAACNSEYASSEG